MLYLTATWRLLKSILFHSLYCGPQVSPLQQFIKAHCTAYNYWRRIWDMQCLQPCRGSGSGADLWHRGSFVSEAANVFLFQSFEDLNFHPRLRSFLCRPVLRIHHPFVISTMTLENKWHVTSCVLSSSEYLSHRSCQYDFPIKQHSFRTTICQNSTYYA